MGALWIPVLFFTTFPHYSMLMSKHCMSPWSQTQCAGPCLSNEVTALLLKQRCDASAATSGSVKLGCDCSCFYSISSCYKFSCFLHSSFKIISFFVSKVSLKFLHCCLILADGCLHLKYHPFLANTLPDSFMYLILTNAHTLFNLTFLLIGVDSI